MSGLDVQLWTRVGTMSDLGAKTSNIEHPTLNPSLPITPAPEY